MNHTSALYPLNFYEGYKNIATSTVDLLIVDPPYGVLKTVDWDAPLDWDLTEKVFADLLSQTGQAIIFCNFKLMIEIINTFGKYLEFRHFHVWLKSCALPTSQYSPIPNSEHILVFKKKGVKPSDLVFNPKAILQNGKPYTKKNHMRDISTRQEKKPKVNNNETGARFVKQVIQAPSKPNMFKAERSTHPTQKPLLLMRELIRVYSNPGQLIVSPFAGSGTDLIAAEMEGRRCIGHELNQGYYEEAVARIAQYRAQGDLFSDYVS
ncbi:site-specific DNA-methyltransferase [candidate division WWE3 bacterium]|mgnify:FL=1|jgi:site-specific DNA-methyltransferase (adenine-specific)|nr:site-specific DNA-methyltransferase [candidate division WWE3 bacterium]